jgi:hypothetical protein
MQVMRHQDALYVGHTGTTGAGTSILDVRDPRRPVMVDQWDAPTGSHTHKVQVADGLLLVNHEKFPYRGPSAGPVSAGVAVYRLDDPLRPEQVAFWPSTGNGVHRIVWTGGRYAHMSATPEGFRDRIWMVVDLSDPTHPVEAGRWWWPGQQLDEQPDWPHDQRYAVHHALLDGPRAYLGFDDGGMVVLDVTDLSAPRLLSRLQWDGGGATHTCLPLPSRQLVVVTDEQQHDGPFAPPRGIRVVDVSSQPRVTGVCPTPPGDFAARPLRLGRTTSTRTGTAPTAASAWCSRPTSALVYGSTTSLTQRTPSRWRPGSPTPRPGSRSRSRTTCSWTTTAASG